jgi:hypothetical protein
MPIRREVMTGGFSGRGHFRGVLFGLAKVDHT